MSTTRSLVVLTSVIALLAMPLAAAFHLSAGARDAALVAPTESPYDPSVPAEAWISGISEPGDCSTGTVLTPFCGQLRYQEGTAYEQVSPPDQRYPADWLVELRFDAVITRYVGTYGLSTCQPWCSDPTGASQAVSHEGANRADVQAHAPGPVGIVQGATGTGVMNGWLTPAPDAGIVAFLESSGGPTGAEELRALIDHIHRDWPGLLSEEVQPRVCGFTPDAELELPGGSLSCEVPFAWVSGGGEGEPACASATYMCALNTPAWYAEVQCSAVASPCADTGIQTEVLDAGGDSPFDSTDDHDVWHFVVAPTPVEPAGGVEPGFWTGGGHSAIEIHADIPYLAHDLDVFTPATSPAGLP